MQRVAARRLGRADHVALVEVALARRRRPDADGAVGEPHPGALAVGGRVDGDGLEAELVAGADHAHGDLAPVGDEDSLITGARARTAAGRTRPAARRPRAPCAPCRRDRS